MQPRICSSRVERFIQALEQAMPPSYNKQCTKGWSCGSTCISKTKKCSKTAVGEKASYAQSLAKYDGKATSRNTQEPQQESVPKQESVLMDDKTREKVVKYLTPKEPLYTDAESELLDQIRESFEKLPLRKRAGVLAELSSRLYRSQDW